MAATSAASKVFGTTELAEAIFLELPPRDILVNIQRTSQTFKSIVDESTPIQQALFFKPVLSPTFRWDPMENGVGFWGTIHGMTPPFIFVSPFLSMVTTGSTLDMDRVQKSLSSPDASWRRQLVAQPPVNKLTATFDWDGLYEWLATSDEATTADLIKAEAATQRVCADNTKGLVMQDIENFMEYNHYEVDGLILLNPCDWREGSAREFRAQAKMALHQWGVLAHD